MSSELTNCTELLLKTFKDQKNTKIQNSHNLNTFKLRSVDFTLSLQLYE